MKFIVSDNVASDYRDVLRLALRDCNCRRVIKTDSDKSKKLYDLLKDRPSKALWGYEDNLAYFNNNRFLQFMVSIQNMLIFKDFKPFHIIIDKYGYIWIDNIQVATKDMLITAMDVTIGELNFYIVDLRGDIPVIAGANGAISNDLQDVAKAIELSEKHFGDSMPMEAREVNYTLKEFLEENGVLPSMITVSNKTISDYKNFSYQQSIKRWKMAD